MTVRVALGFGANEGDPYRTIPQAVARLSACGLSVAACSGYYETAPVDCVPGMHSFINCAVVGTWSGGAHELLGLTQELETAAGRPTSHSMNSSRVLDIDILLFGEVILRDSDLIIPHPRMVHRLFVLVPLGELAPDWQIPGLEETVAEVRDRILGSISEPWGRWVRPWGTRASENLSPG